MATGTRRRRLAVDGVFKATAQAGSTAARTATLHRLSGHCEHVVTTKYGTATNWGLGLRPDGTVKRNNDKNPSIGGSLVSPTAGGTINWEPPAYNPDTGLFYVSERNGYSMFYLTELDPRGSMGLGGVERITVGSAGSFLTAIEPKTGKIAWREQYPSAGEGGGGGGLLTTAGGLVFGGDAGGNIVAYNASTGKPICLTHRPRDDAPITTCSGRQNLLWRT